VGGPRNNKSKMADGRHLGYTQTDCLGHFVTELHQIWFADTQGGQKSKPLLIY